MKKICIKILSVVLCTVMVLGAAPLSGFVDMKLPDGSGFKKLVENVVSAFDGFSTKAQAATYSGTCGTNLTWSLDTETGVLNITGTGAMANWTSSSIAWTSSPVPWDSYCSYIKTVNIASGVTTIGNYAFEYCNSLTSVTIPDSVTSIGNSVFYYCKSLKSVTIPDSVTSIGSSAFNYCQSLTSVTIPDSVTSIGSSAFNYCQSLTSVIIPDSVTSIGDGTFYSCDRLTSVTIPDSVTSIGNSAFSGCKSLKSVTIPDSVTNIGDNAFISCNSLTSATIPDSVTNIGSQAFSYCYNLTDITVDANNKNYSSDSYGVLFNKDKTKLIQYPIGNTRKSYTIPPSVTTIGDYAFYGCDILTSVTNPDSVTSIGNYAFKSCESLTSITIPDSVTSIGNSAFDYCTSLTSVTIGNSVKSIGRSAFDYCISLTSITIPDSVTTIGEQAFSGCRGLKNITIPDSVTTIGERAFFSCTGLKNITIGKNVKQIGKRAFQCYNSGNVFETINVENLYYEGTLEDWSKITRISEFSNASGTTPPGPSANKFYIDGELLEELVIPETFTEIRNFLFYGIKCIKKVVLPKTVKKIGTDAFEYVTPDAVVYNGTIADWCSISFSGGIGTWHSQLGCNPVKPSTELYIGGYKIRNLEIPSGVEKIQNLTFCDNDKITNVFIPKSVKQVNVCAFYSCNNLRNVYYEGSEEDFKKITFGNYNDSLTKANIHYNSSPDDFGYYIRITAVNMPSMTITEGKKATATAQLYLNGAVVDDDIEFTVISSNPNVLSIENISFEDNTVTFDLKAIKPGVAQITVAETLTETKTAAEIQVTTGNIIFNSQYLPTYYERDQEYNCYSSGLYVSDFKCGLNGDTYKVTFNAWNALSVMGVVCVYDAQGTIKTVVPINRFKGNMATSIKDTLYNGYKVIDDWVWGELLTFKQDSMTTKTEIEVYVPEGGYIEITNNPMTNDYCATLNYVGFIFEYANVVGGTYMDLMTYEGVTEKFSYTVLQELMKANPELLKNFSKKLAETALEKISISKINDVLIGTVEDGLRIFNDGGIDLIKIVETMGDSFITETAEKIFFNSAGCIGFVMNGLFKYSEFINTTSWFLDLISLRTEDSIKIWTIDREGNFCDKGVKGNNVDDEIDLGEQNMVMRSVILSKNDKTDVNFDEVFEKIADEYIVRDIYFQCNGDIMQPGQRIQISIPVPEDFDPELCAIFWVREDGTIEKMDAEYSNGYMQFIATHFSYYAIVQLHTHNYTSETLVEPTCKNDGLKRLTCACGDTYTEVIEKIATHNYASVTTEPTCTEQGYTTYTCECGDSYVADYVDETGHSHASEITTPATHLKEGVMTYTCACGDIYTEAIAKLTEHNYTADVTEPTCTDQGYTTYTCECGDSYIDDYIDAAGHNDTSNDGNCDVCAEHLCDHACHKTGIIGFFWKIVCFFNRIFGLNKFCTCGNAHY